MKPAEVSTLRLYLLRAMYLLIAVGLAILIWPGILAPTGKLSHTATVVRAVLGAVSLLAILGIRYPLQMLPLLFFEIAWKAIWLLAFGLPLWSQDQLDSNARQTLFDCLFGIVLIPLVIPWDYVYRHYWKAPGDRWGRNAEFAAQQQGASPGRND
jgi:hypothetical protein